MKKSHLFLVTLSLFVLLLSGQVLAYPQIYLDQVGVDFDLSPSTDSELNYIPLQGIADYYRINLTYDMNAKEVRGRYGKDYFTLKYGSQVAEIRGKRVILEAPVILVNSHTLVPKDFIQELVKVDFKWRPASPRVIFKEKSIQDSVQVSLYTNRDKYKFGEQVVITLVIKNITNATVNAPLKSSQVYDLKLSYQGNEIWRWSRNKMFTTAITDFKLAPGESKIYNITLPSELILIPAQYQLIGTFASNPEVASSMHYLIIE